ncbi:MAG: cobalt-precorrin-6A reductase [Kutzneria sp.]|nr:cobalt-precorrin-6A reductase [Kutzneria sp.]
MASVSDGTRDTTLRTRSGRTSVRCISSSSLRGTDIRLSSTAVRSTVLVLGGTNDGRRLAAALAVEPELRVVSALAGQVSLPRLPVGQVRIGGFGGAPGLAAWLRTEQADVLVDATHPFASRITQLAVSAATEVGVPLLVLNRPGWRTVPGDDWRWVDSVPAAAQMVPSVGRRALLTTGRRDLAHFAALSQVWFLSRSIEPPAPPMPARCEVLLDRGPFTLDAELALFRRHDIDVLVTKDSGGPGAKLSAARILGVPVIMVRRPPLPPVDVAGAVDDAVYWINAKLRP